MRLNELANADGSGRRTPRRRRDRPRPPRLARARGAHRHRGAAEGRAAPLPRRDLVARARHRHGRRRPRDPGRVAEVGQPRPAADRPRRPRRRRASRRAGSSPSSAPTCSSARSSRSACATGEIEETVDPAQPARRARPADRRDGCADDEWRRSTSSSALVTRAELLRRALARAARERARHARRPLPVGASSPSCARGSSGTAPPGTIRGAQGRRASWRSRTPGTIPDRGLYGVLLPDGRRVGELDEEMVYEARPGQTFLLGASTWRIEEITRDRVIVTPGAGRARRGPVLEGRRHRPAGRARRARSARSRARRSTAEPEELAASLRPRPAAPPTTSSPTCASSRTRPASSRPTATIVVERFRDEIGDWRLCVLSPVRRPRARRLGRWRSPRGCATSSASRPTRSGPTTGSSSTCPTPTSRRRADLVLLEPDELEDLVVARARRLGAVRRALPRERRARAADPARLPGQAHAALAAAAEGADPARGRQRLRALPDHPRDLPRVPARRARPAGAAASCCASCTRASSSLVEVETPTASPFASLAAVRLRRDLHVRGRHAERRAPRGRARRSTATCCASCSARRSCAS